MSDEIVLAAEHVTKSYNSVVVLDDFSISIRPGEVHSLIGHNGAGKSTVIRMLSGSELPTTGSIRINATPVELSSPVIAQRNGIYTVYQELHVIDEMTVTENIFLGHEITSYGFVDRARMRKVTAELLTQYHAEKLNPDMKMKHLSHAHKQLVEIISALHHQARVILLDEPTTALEAGEIAFLLETIRKLTRTGVSFLFITHKLDEAFAVSDHVTVLRNGKTVLSNPIEHVSKEAVVQSVVGQKLEKSSRVQNRAFGETVLAVDNLQSEVLRGASLELHVGEVIGLYGLVGSGRTELLESIYGARRLQSGSMRLFGHPYRPKSPIHALKAGLRLLTEERKRTGIIPQLDGRVNMTLSSLHRFQRGGFVQRQSVNRTVQEYVGRLAIQGDMTRPIMRLSGGNQQKVLLAKWLLREGTVLLLDEPTKGVDIGVKAEIHAMIRDLAHQGHSLIVVSSEVEEILDISDTVVVMSEGRTKSTVFKAETVTEQALLVEAMEA